MSRAVTSSTRQNLSPPASNERAVLTIPSSANGYQAEESETWLGEWLIKTGRRDEIVLATKYTAGFKNTSGPNLMQSNFGGNSAKSLHVSVEASLKKLQTSYIDLVPSQTLSPSLRLFPRRNNANPSLPPPALRSLLGHAHLHPRSDAVPQLPRLLSQSPLPRHIRYPGLACREM